MLFFASRTLAFIGGALLALVGSAGCGSDDDDSAGVAHVQLKNDFNNPEVPGTQPPWTLCKVSYRGVQFGKIELGATPEIPEPDAKEKDGENGGADAAAGKK